VALVHDDDPVADRHHHVHVVLDHAHGRVPRPQVLDMLQQLLAEHRCDTRHRLVQQDHAWLRHQRAAKLEELPLAARQCARVVVGEVVEANEGEHLMRSRLNVALSPRDPCRRKQRHAEALAWLVLGAEHHVFEDAHARQHSRRLECPDEPGACDGVSARAGDVAPLEPHCSAIRANESRDQVEYGRLAGAVGPDQRRDRSFGDTERSAVDRRDSTEGFPEVADLQQHG